MYFTYILECADKTLYVGSTNDLDKRLFQHNNAKCGAHYTKIRRPVVLKYHEQFYTMSEARKRENELKNLKRDEKLQLIENKKTMPIKKTSEIGSKVIRSKAKQVKDIDSSRVKRIIKDLSDAMRQENLVGMAAPQIGISERIFITEVRETTYRKGIAKPDELRVFINPEIISRSKKEVFGYEGCGSVASAGIFGPVKRPDSVKVRAFDEKGKRFELEAKGFLARIIQHEADHLDGIVFIDRVTDTKKLLGREEYIKMKGGKK